MTKRTKKNQPKIVSAINENDGSICDCILVDGRLHDRQTGHPLGKEWQLQPSGTLIGLIVVVIIMIASSLAIEYFKS